MPTRLPEPLVRGAKDSYAALPCATCPGKGMNLCRPLEGALQVEFFDIAVRQRWVPREVIFRAGDRLGPVFKITKGMASVSCALPAGKRQILRLLLPGDVCGYLSEDGRYSFDGEAITEVTTCTFPRDKFEAFQARNAKFGDVVRAELSDVLKEVGLHMASVGQLTARERVANFLVEMQGLFRARGMGALHLPMSRTDIGDYLGLRVETVSRALTALRQRRLIAFRGDHVRIINAHGLGVVAKRLLADSHRQVIHRRHGPETACTEAPAEKDPEVSRPALGLGKADRRFVCWEKKRRP